MSLPDMDGQTLSLAIQLQLEDLAGLVDRKGKSREGEQSDLEIALESYKTELEVQEQVISDYSMCKSISHAVRADADLIKSHVLQEDQATKDRRAALGPQPGACAPEQTAGTSNESPALADDDIDRLAALYAACPDDEHGASSMAESSLMAERRMQSYKTVAPETLVSCIACSDQHYFFDVSHCPCSHDYCRGCLNDLFRASLGDESLFPPRCCNQPIPVDSNTGLLESEIVKEFLAKKLELDTPNPIYCHQPTCSSFIPLEFITGDVASCAECQEKTCIICKTAAHKGDCPEDAATQELLRVAAEKGWQRCHKCRRIVELQYGCHHITCRCGHHFCYACGSAWKTCDCAQWSEELLLARANAVANRDVAAGRVPAAHRAQHVEVQRQNLMENHECQHSRWRSYQGSYQCEECYDVLPKFIYECSQCRLTVCRRCRYNRV